MFGLFGVLGSTVDGMSMSIGSVKNDSEGDIDGERVEEKEGGCVRVGRRVGVVGVAVGDEVFLVGECVEAVGCLVEAVGEIEGALEGDAEGDLVCEEGE